MAPGLSDVWERADRAFPAPKAARLAGRRRLLRILEHLARGYPLVLLGDRTPTLWLDGVQDVIVFGSVLLGCRYVEVSRSHRDHPNVVYFRLSEHGRRKLEEGRDWWRSLSLWQRLAVQVLG